MAFPQVELLLSMLVLSSKNALGSKIGLKYAV